MVHSVSMSSVNPRVRNSTRPDKNPMIAATSAASSRLVIGSVQIS